MTLKLYFSKVNLNSHILETYDTPKKLKSILNRLYININDDITYEKEEIERNEDGEINSRTIKYKMTRIEKYGKEFNDTIIGSILRESTLYVNQSFDESTGELRKAPVPNSEVIDFFFDVKKEVVVFHTTQRFGYKDFNEAFQNLINRAMITEEIYFEVYLLRTGISLENIRQKLKKLGRLESLKIDIIPPNPNDDLLNDIHQNGEKYLDSAKQGNVTHKSILYTSKSPAGLKLDAPIIENELNIVQSLHSSLSEEESIQKGYIIVEAVSKNGRSYTTKENNPIKDTLEEKPPGRYNLALVLKKKLEDVFNSLL